MARLPYLDPAEASPRLAGQLAALPPMNIFRMLAHAETAFEPFVSFGGAILSQLQLDPKLRELAVLQVAKDTECAYEWVQHAEVGRLVGLSDAQIAAVEDGAMDDDALFSDAERAVLRFTGEVVRGPHVSDRTFAAVSDRLTPREVIELLLTIGNYMAAARLMTTLEMEVDAPVGMDVTDGTRSLLLGEAGEPER
jgi:4-carboxymuconolactone decarboxylase